ncbi:hypothetical protein WAI453_010202 [Rhynchosporium graminicola]
MAPAMCFWWQHAGRRVVNAVTLAIQSLQTPGRRQLWKALKNVIGAAGGIFYQPETAHLQACKMTKITIWRNLRVG